MSSSSATAMGPTSASSTTTPFFSIEASLPGQASGKASSATLSTSHMVTHAMPTRGSSIASE